MGFAPEARTPILLDTKSIFNFEINTIQLS